MRVHLSNPNLLRKEWIRNQSDLSKFHSKLKENSIKFTQIRVKLTQGWQMIDWGCRIRPNQVLRPHATLKKEPSPQGLSAARFGPKQFAIIRSKSSFPPPPPPARPAHTSLIFRKIVHSSSRADYCLRKGKRGGSTEKKLTKQVALSLDLCITYDLRVLLSLLQEWKG